MLEVKKFLKKVIKRKVGVTDALVVSFLISGNLIYGLDAVNDTILQEAVIIEEDVNSLINNGTISVTHDGNKNSVNGIDLKNAIINRIENNGIISSIAVEAESNANNGNGIISIDSQLEILENSGTISGYVYGKSPNAALSGNGVAYAGSNSHLKNIVNSGIIVGNLELENSNNQSFNVGNGIRTQYKNKPTFNLINSGFISGRNINPGHYQFHVTGNGVYSLSAIKNIENVGFISGYSEAEYWNSSWFRYSGNGIYSGEGIDNIKNKGFISGNFKSNSNNYNNFLVENGNGIHIGLAPYFDHTFGKVEYIETVNVSNEGTVSGYLNFNPTAFDSGSGVVISGDFSNVLINNTGLIKGTYSAISFVGKTIDSPLEIQNRVNNYGILAGNQIFYYRDDSILKSTENVNYGIHIDLNDKKIEIAKSGIVKIDGTDKHILNGTSEGKINTEAKTIDSIDDLYINSSNLTGNKNLVINGVGKATGALTVNNNISLENSNINAYETALYIHEGKSFTGTDVIFNGGGLNNEVAVIKGDDGKNILKILGESVINGSTDLGDGDDNLILANSAQVNGTLNGGAGRDSLNLGLAGSTETLSIFQNISDFENISTNGNIVVFETVDITGVDKINIESGNLTLRIDPTIKDENGLITGHAFYQEPITNLSSADKTIETEEAPTIVSTGGYLVLGLNGLGENSVVNMGTHVIDPNINNDAWWETSDYLITNSLVLDAKLQDDGNVLITVKDAIPLKPSIPLPPVNPGLYDELNKIYQSIVSSGEIGKLANTTLLENKTHEEALGGLLSILDQLYANNPYAYTLKSSRDSLKLFEDNLSYLTINPKKNQWIFQGKGFYSGVKNDNSDSGKGYYGFDTDHRNYKTTTSFGGGLATAEYGLTDDSSVGLVLGGGNQNTNFKGSSKIEGNTLYLGAFAKKEINQFKFMSGIGYQYGSLKGERSVNNKYDYFKTDDTYDVNSLNAFAEAKYDYALNSQWTLSPKAKLSWYYVSQDSVNEGYEPEKLSLKVASENRSTADIEVSLDLKNTLSVDSGKLSNILSAGVINTIGDRNKKLTGNILGEQNDGSEFNIQGVELPKTSGKVSYNLEYERTNGMIYTAGISYEFAKDNNRNVTGIVGIGFKF